MEGRKTTMEHMNNWVGVDQGCTKMLMTASYQGEWIDKKVPTGMDCTPEYLIEQVNAFIDALPFRPAGIGMAVVGLVEGETLVSSDVVRLTGMKASRFDREGCRCYFINDVKAAMVCESENYPNHESIALVMAGSGFALSVREKDTQVLGRHGWAGEIGSVYYPIDGGVQKLDDISGGMGILHQAGCGIEPFLDALQRDDAKASAIIQRAATYFGYALINIIHTFNPEYLIIGGSTATFKNYMQTVKSVVQKYTYPSLYEDCTIVAPKDNQRIVALGARLFGFRQENSVV